MKSETKQNTIRYDKSYRMSDVQNEWYEANIGAYLEKTYPGYIWVIEVKYGTVTVTCPGVNKDYGFKSTLHNLYSTGSLDFQAIMLAGGEILERHNVSRIRADYEALANAPRNIKGDMKHDV